MDNDIKITKEISPSQRHKDVLLFLNEELNNLQTSDSNNFTYDLEKEYAKTKKHKSPFVMLVLLGCALAVFATAYLSSLIINRNNEKITVNLSEFEDLNLKNLLNSVSKAQVNYDNAVKEKTLVEAQRDSEISEVESQRENDLFIIDSLNLTSASQIRQRKGKINSEYDAKIREIKNKYEAQILQLEKEIETYKVELESYDSNVLESAKQQEAALDSQRKVQQMEIQKITDMYEKRIADLQNSIKDDRKSKGKSVRNAIGEVTGRYKEEINNLDPEFKDIKGNLLVADLSKKEVAEFNLKSFAKEQNITDEALLSKIDEFETSYENFKYLKKPVSSLPQKNSVPKYLTAMDVLVDNMGQTFVSTLNQLNSEKMDLQSQINQLNETINGLNETVDGLNTKIENINAAYKNRLDLYTSCVSGLLDQTPFNATVVTAEDKKNITVYVSPKARYLVNASGASVEIMGTSVITGKIYPYGQDYYLFMPNADENGNPLDFDLNAIVPGCQVKILAK